MIRDRREKADEQGDTTLLSIIPLPTDSLRHPEELVAQPPHGLQTGDDHPSQQPIRDHPPGRLRRPHLVVLVISDELVQPHAPVHRRREEQRPTRPSMQEVVFLVREGREEYRKWERRFEGEEDDDGELGEGEEA